MVSATMSSTCSWKTTTPSVSSSAGIRLGWRKRRSLQPCRLLRNGVIMSDLTGPGRNSEMSMMRSSNRLGPNLPMSSRWPGLSIWKHAEGAGGADQLEGGGVVVRHLRLVVEVDLLARDPRHLGDGVGHRRLHPDAEDVELEEARASRRRPCRTGSSGTRSSSPRPGCGRAGRRWTARRRTGAARCAGAGRRGASTRSKKAASRGLSRPRLRSSGRSAMACRASLARMCGNALAISSTSTGGSPSAAPTSRIAWRTL